MTSAREVANAYLWGVESTLCDIIKCKELLLCILV